MGNRMAERRRRGGGVKEARVAEREEAGWWSEGGESCGAARPGISDIGSWSCGATGNIVQEPETDRGGLSRGATEDDTFSIA